MAETVKVIAHEAFPTTSLEIVHVEDYRQAFSHIDTIERFSSFQAFVLDFGCPGKRGRPDDANGSGGLDTLRDIQAMEVAIGHSVPVVFVSTEDESNIQQAIEEQELRPLAAGHIFKKPGTYDDIKAIFGLLIQEAQKQPKPAETPATGSRPDLLAPR